MGGVLEGTLMASVIFNPEIKVNSIYDSRTLPGTFILY